VATDGRARPGLRVAVVGPAHPYKGGVAAHTTELAHRLSAAGHDTLLVSWSRLYPEALYPGEQAVPDGAPDLPPFPRTLRVLRWDRPGTWWRTGRRLRGAGLVVLAVVVPVQVPALLVLIRALRGGQRRAAGARPRVVVIAHNVLPHEPHPGDAWLIGWLLRSVGAVLVHSARLADQAAAAGARQVLVAGLPPHLPGGVPVPRLDGGGPAGGDARRTRVLALGMVREYKGFDLLLEAAAQVPDVEVTIAGEHWGRAGERLRDLAHDPRLAGRVRLEAGYVPAERIAVLAATHDVLALPYRQATASQNVTLAHAHRLPVVATATGTFASQVRDGVDGLVVPPGDVAALAAALREVACPRRLAAMRRAVPPVDIDGPWHRYLETLVRDPDGEQR
jgi:glycosyltransferase involved in cell wall biosynthesis